MSQFRFIKLQLGQTLFEYDIEDDSFKPFQFKDSCFVKGFELLK